MTDLSTAVTYATSLLPTLQSLLPTHSPPTPLSTPTSAAHSTLHPSLSSSIPRIEVPSSPTPSFLDTALHALSLITTALHASDNSMDSVSLADKASIRSLIQLSLSIGVVSRLAPGIGIPLSSRSSLSSHSLSLVDRLHHPTTHPTTQDDSNATLFRILEALLALAGPGLGAPILDLTSGNEIFVSLLAGHVTDLIAGYVQVSSSPPPSPSTTSPHTTPSFSSPGAIGATPIPTQAAQASLAEERTTWLASIIRPDMALETGMILLGMPNTKPRPPLWMATFARRLLVDTLMRRNGVYALLTQMLQRGTEDDLDTRTIHRAVAHLTRIPRTVPESTYVTRIVLQLLGILSRSLRVQAANSGRDDEPAITRTALLTLHSFFVSHTQKLKELVLRPLFAPLFPLYASPDPLEGLMSDPTSQLYSVEFTEQDAQEAQDVADGHGGKLSLVTPEWMVTRMVSVLHLLLVSAPPPSKLVQSLRFALPLLFAASVTARNTKSHIATPARQICSALAKAGDDRMASAFVALVQDESLVGLSSQAGSSLYWFAPGPSAGLHVRSLSLASVGDMSIDAFTSLVPVRNIELEAETLVAILQDVPSSSIVRPAVFFGLLSSFVDVRQAMARDAQDAQDKAQQVLQTAATQAATPVSPNDITLVPPTSSAENGSSNEGLTVAEMEAAAASVLTSEIRVRILHTLGAISEIINVKATLGNNVGRALDLAAALLHSRENETLSLVLQLVGHLVFGRVDVPKSELAALDSLAPLLQGVAQAGDAVASHLREQAEQIRVLILTRDPQWATTSSTSSNSTSNSEGSEDEGLEARLREALEALSDPLLPVRAAGLVQLRKVVMSSGMESERLTHVKAIFEAQLADEDAFVYTAAVEGLAFVADAAPDVFLPDLVAQYEAPGGSIPFRLKVGEALLRVLLIRGQILGRRHGESLISAFLRAGSDEEELIRASGMANLAELAGAHPVPAALRSWIEETILSAVALLARDSASTVRRSAALLCARLASGLGSEVLSLTKSINDVKRQLQRSMRDDPDDVVRGHAERGFHILRQSVRQSVFGSSSSSSSKHALDFLNL